MLLSLLLAASGIGLGQDVRPTETELRRARQLLIGPWKILAATDDGQEVGPELFHSRMVKDGRVVINSRTITYVTPETGRKHTVGYMINPARQPREIDLISPDERILPGIYKIEGEHLVVCYDDGADAARPTEFESKPGSSRLLLRLEHLAGEDAKVTAAESLDEVEMKGEVPVPAPPASHDRPRATQQEIARDRDLMAGLWDISSIRDDGETLGASLIRQKVARDGKLRIGSRGLSVTSPVDDSRRLWAYRIDPAASPKEIDLINAADSILKGIYTFDDDRMIVCVAKDEDLPRPTAFEAPAGSRNVLYTLRIAKPAPTRPEPVAEPAPPEPTPAEIRARKEGEIREMLVGSWSTTDSRGTLVIVIRPDGTFSGTRTLARPRLFQPGVITSAGSWTYANGVFSANVSSTTDRDMLGYSYVNRLQSISPTSLVMGGGVGPLKTYRKL